MSNAARTRPLGQLPQAVADLFELEDLAEVLFAAYLRVSFDKSEVLRSTVEQFGDLNAIFARRPKWKLDAVYDDEEGSASPYRKKERKDFGRLMDDLHTGNFAAHVIAVWEASRGAREVAVWDQFLRLCEQRGIIIFVTSMKKFFDPRNPVDWNDLQQMGVKAEFEVRQSRQRVKRATDANQVRGDWTGGRRPFGYDSDGRTARDGTTSEGGINERQLIVDAVDAVLGGASIRSIAADWTARGIRSAGTKNNPDGNLWKPNSLRKVLMAPRLAGMRVSDDGVVIKRDAWDKIISEAQHQRVVAVLNSRKGAPAERGRTPRLLTGILVCEACKAPLVANSSGGSRIYCCRQGFGWNGCGSISIRADETEDLLGVMATERLDDIVNRRDGAAPDDEGDRAELDRLKAMRVKIGKQKIAGKIDPEQAAIEAGQVAEAEKEVNARIAAKARSASAAVDFLVAAGLIGKAWEDCTPEEKRRKITAVIDTVEVGPATNRGSHTFDKTRITRPGRIGWKDL